MCHNTKIIVPCVITGKIIGKIIVPCVIIGKIIGKMIAYNSV